MWIIYAFLGIALWTTVGYHMITFVLQKDFSGEVKEYQTAILSMWKIHLGIRLGVSVFVPILAIVIAVSFTITSLKNIFRK